MPLRDYFKAVPAIEAEALKRYLAEHDPETFNLVDVRQPEEYAREHIPGALLIPLGTLEERAVELDPNLPTFTY